MKVSVCVLLLALISFSAAQFIELSPAEYSDNQTILESLNFGTSHIMREGVNNGTLPEGEYEISQVNKVEQQVLANGTEHRFEFEIVGPQGADITGFVTVYYEWATEARTVVDFKYHSVFHFGEESTESFEGYENWEGSAEEAEFSWENYEFEFGGEEGLINDSESWALGEDDFMTFN